MFKKVSGTKDLLPQDLSCWQEIEEIAGKIFSIYNYQEIRTPIIEEVSLFSRSLGEFAEIVQKQMFLIKNKEETFVLRPEGTASIVRAYIENNLDKTKGFVKFYYLGPMFRLERPQKGRLRQFHHIGAEVIGSANPEIDVEIISLIDALLKAYQINNYKIKINTLGCRRDKQELIKLLKKELKNKLKNLCAECRVRFKNNILRILDCKNAACQETVKKLKVEDKYLCQECITHFSEVKKGLDTLKIEYELTPHLVRGLDYYSRTVFEIQHPDLGAQDALGAGGRYDNLVKELGGPDLGAMGFALGVERVLLVKNRGKASDRRESRATEGSPERNRGAKPRENQNLVYVITLGEEAKREGLKLLDNLRKAGISADTDYEGKSLKGAMRKANDFSARYVVIIGENELKKGLVMLKDMSSGEQREIKAEDLVKLICSGHILAEN